MNQKIKIQTMMMTEVICAVALLGMISTCFFMTVNGMKKAEANFIRENRAIILLDNTLERAGTLKERTSEKVKIIFDNEYRKSSLFGNKKIIPNCEIRKNEVHLTLKDTRGRTVAETKINIE